MTRLLRFWLGVLIAVVSVAVGPASATLAGAPLSQPVPIAVRPLAGFYGTTLANAEVGYHCDWPGQNDYVSMDSQSPSDCVTKCNTYGACTHFTYQSLSGAGGRCYLKRGPATAKSATLRKQGSVVYLCGLLPERLVSMASVMARMEDDDSDDKEDDEDDDDFVPPPTPSPVPEPAGFHGDTLGNAQIGHNCDWPGMNDFANMASSSPSDCLSSCNAHDVCTHFVYEKTVGYGGWCHLKYGFVTVEEAKLRSPSSTTYTCGILPERLAPSPSPTATPTQTPPPSSSSDSTPTATPFPDSPSVSHAYKATCNVRKQDCDDAKAAILDRYLNDRCLPQEKGGLLALSAAALSDALSAIQGYDCCALELDRISLLSVARFLVSSDTCAPMDAAPLPTKTVSTSLTNSTTVERSDSEPGIPPVDTSVIALGALGVLSGNLAKGGAAAAAHTNRRQIRQLARNTVVINTTNPKNEPHCCNEMFVYDNRSCCPGWCWIVSDILPFFDLQMCCIEHTSPFTKTCPS